MSATDRRLGVSGSAAFKLPCVAATTTALGDLEGLLYIDDIQLADGDRVLVKDEGSAANGIYTVSTSSWTRAIDFDGPRDVVKGTLVLVISGTVNGNTVFQQTAANPTIGTTALTFAVTGADALSFASAFVQTLLDDTSAAAFLTTLGAYSSAAVDALLANYFLKSFFAAKGDILTATANDTPALLTVGANGTVAMARSAATTGLAYAAPFKSLIYGLTYANNVADATNDIDIAAGGCMDATNAYWITLAAITKRLDAAWAVGTNQGGLDTGSIGNSDYYIWAIARSDTGVTDALFSLSSTSPTMPANYDFKRLIGWFKRVGATIVAFHTYETNGGGIEMRWDSPTLDINLANTLTTTRRTDAVKVPLNFSVIAEINAFINDGASLSQAWIYCPDQTDLAPSQSAAPLGNNGQEGAVGAARQMFVRTSSAGLIAARSNLATVDLYAVSTIGFNWARR